MIIGLIGNQRVGKDTVADYLVSNYNFKKYSFADPIKKVAKTIFNWNDEQCYGPSKDILDTESGIVPRDFFKWFGTDIMQYQFDTIFTDKSLPSRSIWAYSILNDIKTKLLYNPNQNIIITDFRFNHEYKLALESYPDMKFILVSRNDLSILNQSNNWEYEIDDILTNILNTKPNTLNIIRNISNLNSLYNNINTLLQSNAYSLQLYNVINCDNIKNMHFC